MEKSDVPEQKRVNIMASLRGGPGVRYIYQAFMCSHRKMRPMTIVIELTVIFITSSWIHQRQVTGKRAQIT